METPTKKRTRAAVPQSFSLALLLVAVAGAGLAAFVTRGKNSVPSAPRVAAPKEKDGDFDAQRGLVPRDVRKDAVRKAKGPPGEPTSAGVADLPEEDRAQEIAEIHVPSPEEALRQRRERVTPRVDIVERGLAALLAPPKCKAPAELSEAGLSGRGLYGCVIETGSGAPHVVGRAAHRKRSGNFEVGDHQNGQRSGPWKQYYPTGVLAAEGSYVDGQRDGVWHEYDPTGGHRISRSYDEGRKHGVVIRYAGETAAVDLYFEGAQYDPESKEPMLRAELAEAL